jgi:hypothetical protein
MFDYEKLIVEVESKPYLWNIGNSYYHNKHFKALAWASICNTMYSVWNELSGKEKDERDKLPVGMRSYRNLHIFVYAFYL